VVFPLFSRHFPAATGPGRIFGPAILTGDLQKFYVYVELNTHLNTNILTRENQNPFQQDKIHPRKALS